MAWTIQLLEKCLDIVIVLPGSHSGKKRFNHKGLTFRMPVAASQPKAQQSVDGPLEGFPGPPGLFFDKDSQIVVNSEGGSHIMMFVMKAS